MLQCSVQNFDFAATALPALYCRVQNLYTAVAAKSALQHSYNISRRSVLSRYCRDSHPDQGCTLYKACSAWKKPYSSYVGKF